MTENIRTDHRPQDETGLAADWDRKVGQTNVNHIYSDQFLFRLRCMLPASFNDQILG